MGRLSDNLFYAQEKSHKHWLLSLDNLGQPAEDGYITWGFGQPTRDGYITWGFGQPAGDGYITWGFGQPAGDGYKRNIPVCPQKDRPRRPQNMGTDTKGPSPCVPPVCPKRTVPVCPPKGPSPCVQKDRPRVSADTKGPSPCVLLLSLSLLSC